MCKDFIHKMIYITRKQTNLYCCPALSVSSMTEIMMRLVVPLFLFVAGALCIPEQGKWVVPFDEVTMKINIAIKIV